MTWTRTGDTLVNLPLPRQQKIEHTCRHAARSHLPCTCTRCTINPALDDHTGNLGVMTKRLAAMNKRVWLALWFVALMIAMLSSTSSVRHVHAFHSFLIPIWIKWVSGIMWWRALKESGSLRLDVFGTVLLSWKTVSDLRKSYISSLPRNSSVNPEHWVRPCRLKNTDSEES